jgi:hypothetical protein
MSNAYLFTKPAPNLVEPAQYHLEKRGGGK